MATKSIPPDKPSADVATPARPIQSTPPERKPDAKPQRHRMAGSHDGMYVTEHHRGAKKR